MEVSNKAIMRHLKTGNAASDERTYMLIEEIVCTFREAISPKNVYAMYNCMVNSQTVTLGGMTISSSSLAGHLKGCCNAVLLAATLGAKTDMVIRRYSIQDMGKTLIAQSVCTAMLEAYLDEVENDLLQIPELKGLYPVTRYSPGYGDFDITCQNDILPLLDASRIGISLTDGYMMLPLKSVTAIIGFTRNPQQAAKKCTYNCASCADTNCRLREVV